MVTIPRRTIAAVTVDDRHLALDSLSGRDAVSVEPATRSPTPKAPADNPISQAKVDLGRRLFYDSRLSGNGRYSCASCHQQARAFTDGRAHALGSTGGLHARSTMTLANVAYNVSYGWADASLTSLEAQMAIPMFNEHPIEMGMKGHEHEILARSMPIDGWRRNSGTRSRPISRR